MAYNYSFADNEIYSANDLNAITKRLITTGIEDSFSDGVAYNVSRFNEQGNLLYTSGVVPENCLTLKVVHDGEDKILINPGVAFFADGAVIEVEEGGESLSFVNGAKNYVYLKNDLHNKNVCMPVCTTEEPTGDFVLLAEIDENGNISDKRVYAKGKLPGYQSLGNEILNIKDKIEVTFISPGSGYGSKTYDIGNNNLRYIFTVSWPGDNEYGTIGVYDIANDRYLSGRADESFGNSTGAEGVMLTDSLCVHSVENAHTYSCLKFTIADGKLTVKYEMSSSYMGRFEEGATTEVDIDLILF